MTENNEAVRAPECPSRRVGTFTLGITLVIAGGTMLLSLFWSGLPVDWVFRLTPCILVSLGTEVLLAARGGGKVRYDWLGMFLCFILTIFALALYGAAWWMTQGPGLPVYDGSWNGSQDSLVIHYDYFNTSRTHWMELEKGDTLEIRCGNREGWLYAEICSARDGEQVFGQELAGEESLQAVIPAKGEYYINVYGHKASGHASFVRVPGPGGEDESSPEEAGTWWEGYDDSQAETAPEAPPEETDGGSLPSAEPLPPGESPEFTPEASAA